MQAACLVINGYFAIHRLEEVNQLSAQEDKAYVQKYTALVARIQERDDGLYRMECNRTRTVNDPLYFGYHGVSHYSSDFDAEFLRFLGRMGLNHTHYPHSVCQREHAGDGGADGHQIHPARRRRFPGRPPGQL